MPQPIEVRTFRQILEGHYRLTCSCPGCRKTAQTDLQLLVSLGMGDRDPEACRPRCRRCGSLGQWTLEPPMAGGPGVASATLIKFPAAR